jgi:hypothetical protein
VSETVVVGLCGLVGIVSLLYFCTDRNLISYIDDIPWSINLRPRPRIEVKPLNNKNMKLYYPPWIATTHFIIKSIRSPRRRVLESE